MRNIGQYTKDYTNSNSFENYQVKFRRKKVLEIINFYKPRSLLEIGCGLEPIGLHTKLEQYTICEPSKYFCDIAKEQKEEIQEETGVNIWFDNNDFDVMLEIAKRDNKPIDRIVDEFREKGIKPKL